MKAKIIAAVACFGVGITFGCFVGLFCEEHYWNIYWHNEFERQLVEDFNNDHTAPLDYTSIANQIATDTKALHGLGFSNLDIAEIGRIKMQRGNMVYENFAPPPRVAHTIARTNWLGEVLLYP